MSHLRRLACLLLLLVALPQALAWAGDTPREKARLLTKTATVLARDGKYDEAVALYEQAWALEPDPILLFNLAVVKQKQGDLVGARDYLQRYLDAETDAKLKEKGALRLATVLAALGTVRIEVDVEVGAGLGERPPRGVDGQEVLPHPRAERRPLVLRGDRAGEEREREQHAHDGEGHHPHGDDGSRQRGDEATHQHSGVTVNG